MASGNPPKPSVEPGIEPRVRPLWSLRVAFAFLTRLGVRHPADAGSGDLARAGWAFPLVGLVVGGIGGGIAAGALALDLPPLLAAILGVAAMVLVTGALHEDGLADVADGFGGAFEREKKLAIMRDSRIGTYGVLVLILVMAGRLAAIEALQEPLAALAAIIAAAVLSRAAMVPLMAALPAARPSGLGADAGRPGAVNVACATIIAVALAIAALGPLGGIIAAAAVAVVAGVFAALAMRQIGGATGDVLGAAQQLTDVTALIAATVMLDLFDVWWA
jgi:adenosylcobinamide-GDP ribazoletransferase